MKRAKTVGVLGLAAGALSLPSAVQAASERYSLIWTMDPVEPALVERTVKPGDVIAEARLLPMSLLTIDANAVADDGKMVAASGAQFTVLQARVRSACTFTFRPTDTFQRIMFGSDQKFTCLVDQDGDGRFESAFRVVSSDIGIPVSEGKIPNKRTPISPVGYRQIPLGEGTGLPRLLFKYSHQDKITGHAYFGICVANSATRSEPCFDGYSGVRSDKLPKEIGAGGALAVATAKEGAAVTLTVKHGFNRQPFKAMEYTGWRFY